MRAFLEMSRDEEHGGGSWAFKSCVWAPTRKKRGSAWPFWSKVADVCEGDIVFHLRGKDRKANFVGYSFASGSGSITVNKPPSPGIWSYSDSFFKADLRDFVAFHKPISLFDTFAARRERLNAYFDTNRKQLSGRKNIFYVRQAGRLQCLNGAYLSDLDEELVMALFGEDETPWTHSNSLELISVETRTQLREIDARIGQAHFSDGIKRLYEFRCCFPGCDISDPRFLVGSHIARWSDHPELRGNMGNGLCLCLIHDKAFESGMFTLDQDFRIFINPKDPIPGSIIMQMITTAAGQQIRLSAIRPLEDALIAHWIRIGLEP